MTDVIIVLWRPGDPCRERLWDYCRERWERLGLPIIEADDPRGLFAARNTGARAAGNWDSALFADADLALIDPESARAAIDLAKEGCYVAPYDDLITLRKRDTEIVLDGESKIEWARAHRRYWGSWVGAFAIGRALFDEIGGFDERFAPYLGQDAAIIHAAATLGRLERIPGHAVHLWHRRGGDHLGHPRGGHPELWGRYRAATGDVVAMRKLLAR